MVAALTVLGIALLCLFLWSPWDSSRRRGDRPLRFYCAAGMAKPVGELLQEFEKLTGVQVEITFGGSGKMLSAIVAADGQGDLFLSADSLHIAKARELGLIDEVIPLATLRPVVVVNKSTFDKLAREGKPITSLKDLLRKDLKVVLANAKIAAIGQVGQKALEAHGVWKQLHEDMGAFSARVSEVGTVNEVATAVSSVDNTAGIVWTANAEQNKLVIIPLKELEPYSEPMQIAVLKKTAQPASALMFARFLNAKDKGGKVFAKHHLEPTDDADEWAERPVLRIDAGAMLKPGLDPVIRRFQEREGVKIDTHYAGCGILVTKMKALKKGDPKVDADRFPDAFFSCEVSFLDQVQTWFDAGMLIAKNDVVLVVAKGKEAEVKDLADLKKANLRVGLGHPKASALGKLTDTLLRDLDLKDAIDRPGRTHPVEYLPEGHLLVNQLRVGALDAIVVYRSNVQSAPGSFDHMTIVHAENPHFVARQPFAIAQGTRYRQLLLRFRAMIVSNESAETFRSKGFEWAVGNAK